MKEKTFLHDLITAGLEIKESPATSADAAYMAKHLVQCTLPHSDPGDVPIWVRKNGKLVLVVRPHINHRTEQAMYPYGSIPRLLLFWLVSEVTRHRNGDSSGNPRRVELGENLDEFMRQIGLSPRSGGGKRGDAARLRDQMERLFRSTISFENSDGGGYIDMQVAPKGEFWWKSSHKKQAKMWVSWIELSEEFYNAITRTAIPVDFRALKALKRSPLALDLYALLAYRTFDANRKDAKGEDLAPIPWEGLRAQMGGEYSDLNNFKKKVRKALQKIAVISKMKFDVTEEGLKVHPGQTPIASVSKQTKTLDGK